jgi:hypothetical protein
MTLVGVRTARRRLTLGASVALVMALFAADAAAQRAPLRDLADRVVEEWGKAGAVVQRGAPSFLYEDETMTVSLPPQTGAEHPCTTIALLGSRGASFHAKVAGVEDDPLNEDPGARAASVAGVLAMESCGPSGLPLDHLRVTSDAGRGAIETVVAWSPAPLPSLHDVLPERTGGVLPPSPDAGQPPALPPPVKRAEVAELRSKHDGGVAIPRATWQASADGSGESGVLLEPGCHRIELFAPDTRVARATRRRRLDVDAEIRDEDDELLARDRSDAADARLELCVGTSLRATVIFAGAPPGSEVVASHAFWPLAEHLPDLWGPEPRARMARALRARHADPPQDDPVALVSGPPGATPIPFEVEPRACYLALAAVTRGHARGLGMRAVIGARDARDERTTDDDAGAVSFCTGDARRVRIEVEARGTALSWGLALYRLGSGLGGGP